MCMYTKTIISYRYNIIQTVEDADGDHVRCRWAESSLNECGGVCRGFPANLNESDVGYILNLLFNFSLDKILSM